MPIEGVNKFIETSPTLHSHLTFSLLHSHYHSSTFSFSLHSHHHNILIIITFSSPLHSHHHYILITITFSPLHSHFLLYTLKHISYVLFARRWAGAQTWTQTWTLLPDQRVVSALKIVWNPWSNFVEFVIFLCLLKMLKLRQAVSCFQLSSPRLPTMVPYYDELCLHTVNLVWITCLAHRPIWCDTGWLPG